MRLKEKRLSLHLTQQELAKSLGISCKTISTYETGTRKPNILILKQIAKLFNCSVDELID